MRKILAIIIGFFLFHPLYAQVTEENNFEQQMENLTEAEESETDDDSYLQLLQVFSRDPLDLNQATEGDLLIFRFLNPIQIASFLNYRRILGPLISILELQSVPHWDIATITAIRPYVTIGNALNFRQDISSRLKNGDHSAIIRWARYLELQRGFKSEDGNPPRYAGSPDRVLFRYKYQYKNLLQYGILGEKDAGEQFFRGAQSRGFDFYSAHFFLRNLGRIRQLAIGDFTVSMGQGLLVYQSMAFRKSVDVMNIKRQSDIFRPYNSAGEYNFFRGAAITTQWGDVQVSVFGAMRRVTANAIAADTSEFEDYISSVLMSGFHRTENEAARRYNTRQFTAGGSLQYRHEALSLRVNAIHHALGAPMQKRDAPYNQYAFQGKNLTGVSADWGYTWKNVHAFGELAHSFSSGKALVAGLMSSLSTRLDLSLLYRNIDRNYHSLYSNAFTESTVPINEKGLFAGVSYRPSGTLRLDAYSDIYRFPWLRYRIDRPSGGRDYLVQVTWKPNKQFEIYSRYKTEAKSINLSNSSGPFHATEDVPRQNWRTHFSYKISSKLTTRGRAEVVIYNRNGPDEETGFLIFSDLHYRPMMSRLTGSIRLQYFETDGFNSRVYAYENDVLYSYSIPPFFYKGYRAYLNVNYDLTRKITVWLRFARTHFANRESSGSGNDLIAGSNRTDVKLQLRVIF